MTKYKVLKSDFASLEKKVNRVSRKLEKQGLKCNFSVIGETVEAVKVYDFSNPNDIPAHQFQPRQLDDVLREVVNYTFNMDLLKIGDFEVIAAIDRIGESNVITALSNVAIDEKYKTISSYCDHCNSKRRRKRTFLLQDQSGNIKQIGSTCVAEYTGIDDISVIKNYMDLKAIIIKDLYIENDGSFGKSMPEFLNTKNYLGACIEQIEKTGYDKEAVKNVAFEIAANKEVENEYLDKAQKIIDYFGNTEFKNDFLIGIKNALLCDYTKISGLVAYSFLAYNKEVGTDNAESQHVGSIKDKIEVNVKISNIFKFGNVYGYNNIVESYIYIFKDRQGNIYKWSTQKEIGEVDDSIVIAGIIKDHVIYKGVKQTVLTRCKVRD